MTQITPTPEQQAIIQAGLETQTSLMVTAYAGAAKTTTLELLANALPRNQMGLALAFNVKIKKELERRFPPNFTVMTLNGLGHRAWAAAIGKRLVLDEKKLGKLITESAKANGLSLSTEQWGTVRALVSLAMQRGLVPSTFPNRGLVPDTKDSWADLADELWADATDTLLDFARSVLIESIRMGFLGTISFDDQIYLSTMFNGVFPRFPLVLVDEAQDLSPLNHIQLRKCAAGRLIVVGDPKQAIYAFRGADTASMSKIRSLRDHWIELPLATTFRCPKTIVERQQDHAPGFKAWASNILGVFDRLPKADLEDAAWTWTDVEKLRPHPTATMAILCRNNAPLLGIAFRLIRKGTPVIMLGRDIGKGLIALSKKIMPQDSIPIEECTALVRAWADKEAAIALANGHDEKLDGINDRAECLLAVIDGYQAQTAGELRQAIERLFASEIGKVTLATGHRAKGLEWELVVHLDPWRVPSKHARQRAAVGDNRAMEQEQNLKYVVETRTKHTLVLANLENFQ